MVVSIMDIYKVIQRLRDIIKDIENLRIARSRLCKLDRGESYSEKN